MFNIRKFKLIFSNDHKFIRKLKMNKNDEIEVGLKNLRLEIEADLIYDLTGKIVLEPRI